MTLIRWFLAAVVLPAVVLLGVTCGAQAGVASSALARGCVEAQGKNGAEPAIGARLVLAECEFNGAPASLFIMDEKETRITYINPNWCADARDGQDIMLVNCKSVTARWRYDSKTKTLRSSTGLCWQVVAVKGRYPKGSPIKAAKCTNGKNQQFDNE